MFKLWTIYAHPRDYPEGYVAREWIVNGQGSEYPGPARYRPDLEAARAAVPPQFDHRLVRNPDDDPSVVETWI